MKKNVNIQCRTSCHVCKRDDPVGLRPNNTTILPATQCGGKYAHGSGRSMLPVLHNKPSRNTNVNKRELRQRRGPRISKRDPASGPTLSSLPSHNLRSSAIWLRNSRKHRPTPSPNSSTLARQCMMLPNDNKQHTNTYIPTPELNDHNSLQPTICLRTRSSNTNAQDRSECPNILQYTTTTSQHPSTMLHNRTSLRIHSPIHNNKWEPNPVLRHNRAARSTCHSRSKRNTSPIH